eukprot:GFUD01013874.1.p1 GENE.GFUD01013874.1~~GFUD01013874.1.p1  ORF type:complete len:958 (+),score=147.78 GFUD01013874.1:41-2914(+)
MFPLRRTLASCLKSANVRLTSTIAVNSESLPDNDNRRNQSDFQYQAQTNQTNLSQHLRHVRVLLLANSFNSMTQRAYLELTNKFKQDVRIELAVDNHQMIDAAKRHNPDLILCPFLTKEIPEEIWKERLCLVVHPGIHGDRGASSIDWALKENKAQWGVTVLQAAKEMDAGDIWSTKNFVVPKNLTKSGLYSGLIIDTAMDCIQEAMKKFVTGRKGIPLNYTDPNVKGKCHESMKLKDRTVDFNASAEEVASIIRRSVSTPGTPCTLEGHNVFLCSVHEDTDQMRPQDKPGTITGKRHGAVRIACRDGSVWVTHMKGRGKSTNLPTITLPATDILPSDIIARVPEVPEQDGAMVSKDGKVSFTDLWVSVSTAGVAVINFPFHNGAMRTDQCKRLAACIQQTSALPGVKIIVLAGGEATWSNGINLNTIEAAQDPAQESWKNINAMNDIVKAIFSSKKVTIAALQGNAGAGGAMAAIACDYVWAHGNTILNPHYKTMGLHGSEYWTYFLPNRVGHKKAQELTNKCLPISAQTALAIGMIDKVLSSNRFTFAEAMVRESDILARNNDLLERKMNNKTRGRTSEWHSMMENFRSQELRIMRENFVSKEYIDARKAFVYKLPHTSTPLHILLNQHRPDVSTNADGGMDAEDSHPLKAVSMDGRKIAKSIAKTLVAKIEHIKSSTSRGVVPKFAIVLVSGNNDSERYVKQKLKSANNIGVSSVLYRFNKQDDAKVLEEDLIECVKALNDNKNINGIIVQLPLPNGVNKEAVLSNISSDKDVDGFRADSLGSLAGGISEKGTITYTPCTAKAIMTLLDYYSVPVSGKKVCIIGRSTTVGMPIQLCIMKRGGSVTNCDINTTHLASFTKEADILIVAAGSPALVKGDWIKPGAVVIDVGFHVIAKDEMDFEIVGDVDPEGHHYASLMTPVPGGVGPLTVHMLIENTIEAFLKQQRKNNLTTIYD